jgi:hypothetical protein
VKADQRTKVRSRETLPLSRVKCHDTQLPKRRVSVIGARSVGVTSNK